MKKNNLYSFAFLIIILKACCNPAADCPTKPVEVEAKSYIIHIDFKNQDTSKFDFLTVDYRFSGIGKDDYWTRKRVDKDKKSIDLCVNNPNIAFQIIISKKIPNSNDTLQCYERDYQNGINNNETISIDFNEGCNYPVPHQSPNRIADKILPPMDSVQFKFEVVDENNAIVPFCLGYFIINTGNHVWEEYQLNSNTGAIQFKQQKMISPWRAAVIVKDVRGKIFGYQISSDSLVSDQIYKIKLEACKK